MCLLVSFFCDAFCKVITKFAFVMNKQNKDATYHKQKIAALNCYIVLPIIVYFWLKQAFAVSFA